ncbi:MAG TPA: adenylate/guanylate cyclase domain-containing protein, partial [bacterium]|nr:adenylate/guanylate cyclase domain-containing protein [bacterium]
MSRLPAGTVTFLLMDIEGSTRLLQRIGDDYAALLEEHRRVLRRATSEHSGQEVDATGDEMFFAFARARDAILAAVEAQGAILSGQWPGGVDLKVRMGLHTGEPARSQIGYVGSDVHRAARIRDAAHGGQIILSEAVQALVGHNLPAGVSLRDLGSHRLKDLTKPIQLFQVVASGLEADFPPLRSLSVLGHNLRIQLTSFVGREREIREVKALLPGARLFTLTGIGGVGKTRMAMQVAAEVLGEFPDGIWVVELGRISNPSLVPHSVASAVGALEEQGGRPLTDTLVDFLQSRTMLLILDNCEHLLTECANLALGLLRACRSLRILATSLGPLGVPGEFTYPVSSLALSGEAGSQSEAVRLFIDRASSTRPGLELRTESLAAIVEICRRLDGIPLAIELAAALVKVLAPEQILERLVDRFRLLTGGRRLDLPQHQTLRAVMDWAYHLLAPDEQVLLRRLAAFAGSFPLEAAESACAGDEVNESNVVELLTRLVDKSLVATEEHPGTVRYHLLETVREYGREKLRDAGEFATIHTRHRDWYLALAERAAPEILSGPHQRDWLERVDVEHDNLRAALEWIHEAH